MHTESTRARWTVVTALTFATVFSLPAAAQLCPDDDLDGWSDCTVEGCDSMGLLCGDCDDGDGAVNPDETEVCNHIDDNCDGRADEGSPELLTVHKLLDPRAHADDRLGYSVAVIGDVTGDGLPDIAAGAYLDDEQTTDAGSVVLLSGADRSFVCRMTDPGGLSDARLGFDVAGVGDVTGDGVPDVVAGAFVDDETGNERGSVSVFSGADCSFVRKLTDPGGANADRLGVSVAAVGDLDGDGVTDVAAGAYLDNTATGGSNAGSVVLFSGADGSFLRKLTDPQGLAGDQLGISVAGIADVNGDGTPDILAGALLNDSSATDAGSVVIFSGADDTVLHRLVDPDAGNGDRLGRKLAAVDDLDGDGVPDVVAGAHLDDTPQGADSGSVVLFSGATGGFIRKITDPDGAAGDYLGFGVSGLPDVSGDGIPDVLAGVYLDDTARGSNAGSVLVFSGADGSVIHRFEDPTGVSGAQLGLDVTWTPDACGDGDPDFIAGAWYDGADHDGMDKAGSVVIFSLDSDCDGDGVAPCTGDCDDTSTIIHFGHVEECDGVDNDCDEAIDEDEDNDGYGVCNDCFPLDPLRHPDAPERCNGLDDDCDDEIDEGPDADQDLWMAPCDCDDDYAGVYPGATELCNNQDDDCNGQVDEASPQPLTAVELTDPERAADDHLGSSVDAIGDVTGDGVPDIVAGVPGDLYSDRGSAVIFSGFPIPVVVGKPAKKSVFWI